MCIMDRLMGRALGIPGLIFQAKVAKFGTNVGLNMLINISSEFITTAKIFGDIFTHPLSSHSENHR